jgi:hypothetical protein
MEGITMWWTMKIIFEICKGGVASEIGVSADLSLQRCQDGLRSLFYDFRKSVRDSRKVKDDESDRRASSENRTSQTA